MNFINELFSRTGGRNKFRRGVAAYIWRFIVLGVAFVDPLQFDAFFANAVDPDEMKSAMELVFK